MHASLPNGIYPPLPTFFTAQEELDLSTLRRHMEHLVDSGIAGYVLLGSNGEAVHLSEDEREQVVVTAREVASQGEDQLPLIVGCGAQSTRMTLAYCRQAARAGADMVLILPPSYYKSRMSNAALLAHYRAIADQSPLPVLIYNMPGSSAGLDLDANTVCALAEHPNIVGVKDSSGNVVKLAEIVANVSPDFRVLAGSADFFLPALAIGATGTISALANIFPHEVCLLQALFEAGELEEARILQAQLIPANAAVTSRFGVAGLKAALQFVCGYGGVPRLPLLPLSDADRTQLIEILKRFPQDDTF
ncbi:MAG TPA: dihydrodipicolinate synthase family protein [Ktedonobacteraceae bacterium]|jgi:4-hydroxy-2-oxoglutarate aldolase|nr:dihydrodipicolinate synthase family protein [Ktedonobacteraceae bacterium]